MQIVILCGGLATRLYPLTKKTPKSMVKIRGKPFLEYQIELFKKNKIYNILLSTGYLSEQIEEYFKNGEKFGVKIRYSKEEKLLDTGGALKKAKPFLEKEFFIIYGDSYLPINFQKVFYYFKKFNKLGLMCVYKNYGKIEPSNVIVKEGLVEKFDKENPNQPGMVWIEYGLNIFKREVLDLVEKEVFPLGDYFKELIKKKELLAYEVAQRYYQIGDFKGMKEFENYIKNVSQ